VIAVAAAPPAAVAAVVAAGVPAAAVAPADAATDALMGRPATCSRDCSRELKRPCVEVGLWDALLDPVIAEFTPFLWPGANMLAIGEAAMDAAVEIRDMMTPR
jgi:hypothetical protein